MKFSITEMIAQLNKHYPVKPYLYEVRIFGGSSPVTDASPEIMFNCSAVNVPGLNIAFSQFRKFGIGTMHNVPIGRSFTEMNMTFYETDGEPERQYFYDWQNRMFNQNTMRFAYFQDIVKTISIVQYDKKENKTYECKVYDCFPSNISPLDRGYSNEGLAQFNVNMQFYRVEELFFDKKAGFNPFSFLPIPSSF